MSETARNRILTACFSFLVPVARFLLHRGISYREFEEIARNAYVKVASDEYGIRGRPTNASRIAAMTGIPRKDVTRIRESLDDYEVTPKTDLSPLGDVLHRWFTDRISLMLAVARYPWRLKVTFPRLRRLYADAWGTCR